MGTIVATETSRTNVTWVTLPYTIAIPVYIDPHPVLNSLAWQDRAVVTTGAAGSGLTVSEQTFEELGATSSTQTILGSGTPTYEPFFGLYQNKIFVSETGFVSQGDPSNNVTYFYIDYTPGVPMSPVTSSVFSLDGTWRFARDVMQPVAWSGLTKAICTTVDVDPFAVTDTPVRALLVDHSGLTDVVQLCVAPTKAVTDTFFSGPVDLVIPDTGKNWFLFRPSSFSSRATSMPCWSASSVTGANLSSDDLTFSASDVNLPVCGSNWFGIGAWLVTPDAFIFFCSRSDWDSANGVAPTNGLVIVILQKDFSSYDVQFISWDLADANAFDVLNNANQSNSLLVRDQSGNFYFNNQDYGVPGSFLSEFVAPPPPPGDVLDIMPRFPPGIALGATGGPGFKTSIGPGDRGTRFQEWDRVRGAYQVDCTVKGPDEVAELLTFFRARRGRAFPFRFKDWSDYQLPDPGRGIEIAPIFITNVTGGTIQIVKVYDDTEGAYVRNITRPVHGTLTLYDNGTLTTDYTVDYSTGIITLGDTLAATSGHEIAVVCEFDVKARFDTDGMTVTISSFEVYSWKSVKIIELFDG